ncbi:MAG: hypothetical protein IJM61_00595 [Firmicutes bacterium]|nr:hypothetical protein [Bacillota bacterium]
MKTVHAKPDRELRNDIIYGDGGFRYKANFNWPQYPEVLKKAVITALFCDEDDNLFVLTREPSMPIVCFAPDGSFKYSCAEGLFYERPHGIYINKQGEMYCTDDKASVVQKLDKQGNLLKMYSEPYKPSDTGYHNPYKLMYDRGEIEGPYNNTDELRMRLDSIVRTAPPFNGPTRMIEAKDGKLICADGYGNAAIHIFSHEGELETTWGSPGTEPGQFRLPHSVWEDEQGRIWEADRESGRIQVFTRGGEVVAVIDGLNRPADLWSDGEYIYVGEIAGGVSIIDMEFNVVAQLGYKNSPLMVHGICGNSKGDLFLASLNARKLNSITKLERI